MLRKAMWPAALAATFIVFLGAMGQASVKPAAAFPGDICAILGPTTIEIGETELYRIHIEDPDEGELVVVDIDDNEGDADITSVAETSDDYEEGEFGNSIGDLSIGLPNDGDWDDDFLEDLQDDWEFTLDPTICGATTAQILDDADLGAAGGSAAEQAAFATSLEAELAAGESCSDAAAEAALDAQAAGATVAETDLMVGALTDVNCGIDGVGFVDITCNRSGEFEISVFDSIEQDNAMHITVVCLGEPDKGVLTPNPAIVEIVPAPGSVAHSLLTFLVTDDDADDDTEQSFPGFEVDWSTDRCVIQGLTAEEYAKLRPLFAARVSFDPATSDAIDAALTAHGGLSATDTSDTFVFDPPGTGDLQTIAAAVLHCENSNTVTPGVATVRATIDEEGPDVTATATVTVVGPPAFITLSAAPTTVICGEKSTITVKVTDAIGQNVSDHTVVELVTNFGGVLGGTGGTLGFPGVGAVNPLSSAAAETFNGVAVAYLLTSTEHVGAYEVVAAAGGSLSGAFSTSVVTSQVTVTCSLPAAPVAPTVTAPVTGTGSITPPNTGDAGLASSSSNAMLFVIVGAAAFGLAGIASVSYARR
jgi:hypothetical protein